MNFFPIVEGMPKELKAGITYALCSNGIFEVRALPGGGFASTKVEGIKGLPEGKEEIRFLKKKIPINIFWEIVRFFKAVNEHFTTKLEAYVIIAFDNAADEYFLWTPPHSVTMGSVNYDIEQFYKLPQHKDCYIVADFHLHPGEMGAFWSGTDDRDDCRDRFSGVIGKLNDLIPNYKIRFSAGKKHYDLDLKDVFCDTPDDYSYDVNLGLSMISIGKTGNTNVTCSSNVGYVPFGGKTLFDMLKEKRSKGMSVKDIMGVNW